MKSYSVKEISDLLHTNPETVRRWIRKGKLDATRGSSRKEGSTVSFAALQKFLEDSPREAVEQLNQEIERDTQSLEELKKLLNQIKRKEIEEPSYTNRSEHEEK